MHRNELLDTILARLAEAATLMQRLPVEVGVEREVWEYQKEKVQQVMEDVPTFKLPRT